LIVIICHVCRHLTYQMTKQLSNILAGRSSAGRTVPARILSSARDQYVGEDGKRKEPTRTYPGFVKCQGLTPERNSLWAGFRGKLTSTLPMDEGGLHRNRCAFSCEPHSTVRKACRRLQDELKSAKLCVPLFGNANKLCQISRSDPNGSTNSGNDVFTHLYQIVEPAL
jgi:hypothetical protein